MSLAGVHRFAISLGLVDETLAALREAGVEGYERFVLWSGQVDGDELTVSTAHFPEQTAYKTDGGLLVRVEGDALHRLNAWLYDHEEVLAAQVHAHPTDAFHSATDDAYPIVTAVGGLSLVLPDFARDGLMTRGTAGYRLTPHGWARVRRRRLRRLIEVVP